MEEEKSQFEKTKEKLLVIIEKNPDDFARVSELGQALSFQEIVPIIKKIIDLYKSLNKQSLNSLPEQRLKNIESQIDQTNEIFEKILNFSTTISNPAGVQQQHISGIKNHYNSLFDALNQLISYLDTIDKDETSSITTIENEVKKVSQLSEEVSKKLFSFEKEGEKIVSSLRSQSGEAGVSKQAIHFSNAVATYEDYSKKWLWATIIIAVVLIGFSVWSFWFQGYFNIQEYEKYKLFQLGVSKFLVFSVLSFFLYLSAKNFNAYNHNKILNEHRVNSLKSFEALVNAANDIENKDIILNHAAHSIFSQQQTGYSKDTTDNGNPFVNTMLSIFQKDNPT